MSTDRVINYVVCEMDEEMKADFQKQVNTVMDDATKESEKDIAEHVKAFFD